MADDSPAPSQTAKPAQVGDLNIAPKTTAEQDTSTRGQRRVNLIWETMQALIAGSVVGCALFVSGRLALMVIIPEATKEQAATASTAFMLISNMVSLIIGFYFGRTNHTRSGGVGAGEVGR